MLWCRQILRFRTTACTLIVTGITWVRVSGMRLYRDSGAYVQLHALTQNVD